MQFFNAFFGVCIKCIKFSEKTQLKKKFSFTTDFLYNNVIVIILLNDTVRGMNVNAIYFIINSESRSGFCAAIIKFL